MSAVSTVLVVVPARDEQARIGACLDALIEAARRAHPMDVRLLVVLDACQDETAAICRTYDVPTLRSTYGDVGLARAAGVAVLATGLDRPTGEVWLASTDADTRVPADWITDQLRLADAGADAVLGVVDVDDWSEHTTGTAGLFDELYAGTRRGSAAPHEHVHGANFGVRLSAYLAAGGFRSASVGEDQALCDRLEAIPGLSIRRTAELRVVTSGRRTSRVRGGFADLLSALET